MKAMPADHASAVSISVFMSSVYCMVTCVATTRVTQYHICMNTQNVRTTLQRLVEDYGSQQAAADAFGTSRVYLNRILNNHGTMGKELALKIERISKGKYRADDLVFGR